MSLAVFISITDFMKPKIALAFKVKLKIHASQVDCQKMTQQFIRDLISRTQSKLNKRRRRVLFETRQQVISQT